MRSLNRVPKLTGAGLNLRPTLWNKGSSLSEAQTKARIEESTVETGVETRIEKSTVEARIEKSTVEARIE